MGKFSSVPPIFLHFYNVIVLWQRTTSFFRTKITLLYWVLNKDNQMMKFLSWPMLILILIKLSVTCDPFDSDIFSFISYLFRKCCSEVF